jgi:hypothetical protein
MRGAEESGEEGGGAKGSTQLIGATSVLWVGLKAYARHV